ncbi:serine/threonine-protein kinase [Actinomadura sp. NAK00032]|uniref:serine/threonine-protein kinase n=1 Tax=Actinomadura sp. NAK00032 TaxID=2742128 RepID=UPI00158FD2FF|nr:serine/threonine-protein kinase [Actinomadura sp. NAK00032]
MQAPLRDRDPRRLGPYRLTARLGRGGMGTVFLGEDAVGRRVAVKVINPELADDEAFHDRFRREVTAARQVRRFCTAAVLDARLDGDPLYVVTEYVAGPSLDEAVRAGGPLRGGDLEALAVNIATALSAIHGAGIVHRDLKPSNVLLSPTGPRVIDFGIARALDAGDGPTRTGQFIGTPAYIAPELMHGQEITQAADVFSWGCVVAYAGTGRVPFAGETLPEIINRVTSADPDLDGLDPAVHDLVARALAKDPSERPTVKQLIRSLTGEDAPVEAAPVEAALPEEPPAEEAPVTVPLPPAPAPRPTAVAADPPTRPAPTPAAAPTTVPPFQAPPTGPSAMPVPPGAPRPSRRGGHRRAVGLTAAIAIAGLVGVSGFLGLRGLADENGEPGSGDGTGSSAVAANFRNGPPDDDDKVFDDNFSEEDSGWKTAATPTWDASYRDRRYELHVLPTTMSTAVDAPVRDVPKSQLIEVKVESVEAGGEAGVYCRGQAEGFAFLIHPENGVARIARLGTERMRTLAINKVDLRDGTNRVQAACVEGDGDTVHLGMWVNGRSVASSIATPGAGDPQTPSGLLLYRPEKATGWPEAVFDDFSLCSV